MSNLIVFAPGWSSLPSGRIPNPLLNKFKKQGYEVLNLRYDKWGTNSIKEAAHKCMDDYEQFIVDKAEGEDVFFDQIAFIGHSMGGLVARYMIQKLDGWTKPKKYVSLGTPHHGTPLARAAKNIPLLGSAYQMAPGSHLLQSLDKALWPSRTDAMTLEAQWDILVPNGRFSVPAPCSALCDLDCDAPCHDDHVVGWKKEHHVHERLIPNVKIPWTDHMTLLTSQRSFWEIYAFLEWT